jgi:hypothetical protein
MATAPGPADVPAWMACSGNAIHAFPLAMSLDDA